MVKTSEMDGAAAGGGKIKFPEGNRPVFKERSSLRPGQQGERSSFLRKLLDKVKRNKPDMPNTTPALGENARPNLIHKRSTGEWMTPEEYEKRKAQTSHGSESFVVEAEKETPRLIINRKTGEVTPVEGRGDLVHDRFPAGAELKRAAEAEDGLRMALERRLEVWHTKVQEALIKAGSVEKPETVGQSIRKIGEIFTPGYEPKTPRESFEESRRQIWDWVESNLKIVDKFLVSLRLRLGGPYPKKEAA